MKNSAFCILLLVSFNSISQINPFEKLKYDKVIAYEYNGEGGLAIEKCLKKNKEKISNTKTLTREQINQLEEILTSNDSYGNTTASCFDPHFAIVYFLKNEIVASISICLDCNYLISSEEIPATSAKKIKISEDYSYPAKGFSSEARKKLHEFIEELNFKKFLKPLQSIYDN